MGESSAKEYEALSVNEKGTDFFQRRLTIDSSGRLSAAADPRC